MELTRYAEKRGWNPLARPVTLTEHELRVGARRTPVGELGLVAVADAWLRGVWLGGGGSERPLAGLPHGPGRLPLVRASGTALPLRVRDVAGFAAALGELAARHAGGAGAVREAARRAEAEGVPLWIARRQAPGPHGRPVVVAVDRRLVRADVWTEGAPPVRLRGPYGWSAGAGAPLAGLVVTIGERPVNMRPTWSRWGRSVTFSYDADPGGAFPDGAPEWQLVRSSRTWGRLLRDGRAVATLARPRPRPSADGLLPLADIRHRSRDPLDAALAHLCGVALGLGEATGTARFGSRHAQPSPEAPAAWELPWYTGLGESREDSGPGASGDGWSDGGGGGADGDSGGGSGGDSGGGDSGGGGGDGGGGGGGE
ncbi:hypothetical protein SAMN06297387_13232 [Streptomyces zhaozhouensis]|uniref:Uncharacterized protein n=1 Tax=Streptomyces zhaozhouensis TaxID=1300267 RepID=A0A286E9R3_9ACTN|nr:hypothetical protein [Streptomyces zhaozhouensis]SOD67633.1 hypothetical protein SAMN06297387_13232 [Streptomyces zhaozhouensis]